MKNDWRDRVVCLFAKIYVPFVFMNPASTTSFNFSVHFHLESTVVTYTFDAGYLLTSESLP